ncbi:carbamoyltransferase HypF [Pectinatus frisingensis]|uniref:carbamoyltransferase HypF n=1 Tax=Pectinatus frisingensis TaxID=865 RepID=UPI002EDAAE35
MPRSTDMKRLAIRVRGIVQGVGFRPFVYRLAQESSVTGFVFNDEDGVFLEVQGIDEILRIMVKKIHDTPPPAAFVSEVVVKEEKLVAEEKSFVIKKSPPAKNRQVFISPDLAICAQCREEVLNQDNRRYHYPFINCTNCGPRFSIVEDVPYDRAKTTMSPFNMCESCRAEYEDPLDRRFHAQPNACAICGPHYELLNNNGKLLTRDNETLLQKTYNLIKAGKIVAIKGIGGFHLVCDAYNEVAVYKLRRRKNRFDKALAVMAGSISMVREICEINPLEEILLKSPAAPIVLLRKRNKYDLAESVAPNNVYLGVMLPYAPVHCLLLQAEDVFVMTSANISEEPIAYLNDDAVDRLKNIADYFLLHNRRINMRVDDSVLRIIGNKPSYIRRSRGFAPTPLRFPFNKNNLSVLAVGSQLKNTFCLLKEDKAFLSHHIGNLANSAANNAYKAAIAHYEKIFAVKPQIAVCDLHPEYFSTKYACSLNLPLIKVQHHHAHIASVLAENTIKEKVIGIALDGTGYGDDGKLWGGEIFLCDCLSYERVAHFSYLPLPGAVAAIKEPWRIAAFIMDKLYGSTAVNVSCGLWNLVPDNWQTVVQIARQQFNSPLSSSAGRLFDTAAALLGIRGKINYEGQAAIELEQLAADSNGIVFPYDISLHHQYEIDFLPVFDAMLLSNMTLPQKAMSFHMTMADAVIQMAEKIKEETGINKVVLSGGVFQNITLSSLVIKSLQKRFTVYINRKVPTNDGGLSFGQAAVACAVINENRTKEMGRY